jgi:hypothetical protein
LKVLIVPVLVVPGGGADLPSIASADDSIERQPSDRSPPAIKMLLRRIPRSKESLPESQY